MTDVEKAVEALAESLTIVCRDALIKAGFTPSEKMLDKIHETINYSITLK